MIDTKPMGRTPRILFLITRADAVGGASIHTRDVAAALRRKGWRAMVGVGGRGPVTDGYKRCGALFVSLRWFRREISPLQDLLALGEIVGLILRFKPDIISAHTSKAGFIGRLAAWLCRVPVIYTPHCWSFVEGFPRAGLYANLERFAALFSTRIVAVSEDEREQGLANGVGGPRLITCIHNGMPDIPSHLLATGAKKRPRLLMTGRFEEQKDHDCLLRALAMLKDEAWDLDLVGDGPRRADCERLCNELGLSDRVHFLGYRTDVEEVLSRSQAFLLITRWEGFPRSILEAMRAALPVVATDVGGIREAVSDGKTGFLVPRGDDTCLAERLRLLICDASLRHAMGQRARSRYETAFTFNRMLSCYLDLYREVLAEAGAGSRLH